MLLPVKVALALSGASAVYTVYTISKLNTDRKNLQECEQHQREGRVFWCFDESLQEDYAEAGRNSAMALTAGLLLFAGIYTVANR